MKSNSYNTDRYDHYVVEEEAPLLEWLLAHLKGSKTKISSAFSMMA